MPWRRPRSPESAPERPAFGVGVQVVVRLNRSDSAFVPQYDPIGVIVAPGQELGTVYWNPPTADDPSWIVKFEEPFYGLDGSGPHDSARVPERMLELAPITP